VALSGQHDLLLKMISIHHIFRSQISPRMPYTPKDEKVDSSFNMDVTSCSMHDLRSFGRLGLADVNPKVLHSSFDRRQMLSPDEVL
jgi:hypothetical protein